MGIKHDLRDVPVFVTEHVLRASPDCPENWAFGLHGVLKQRYFSAVYHKTLKVVDSETFCYPEKKIGVTDCLSGNVSPQGQFI